MKKTVQTILLLLIAYTGQAQYKSLLWRITGNGLKDTSYLYGTMHTGDNRIIEQSKKASPYFNESSAYAMEIDPDASGGVQALSGMMGKLMMGGSYSLKQMIPAKEYAFLDSICAAQLGLPMVMFDNVSPIIIMTLFEGASMGIDQANASSNSTPLLDLYFQDEAKKAHKKIIGIETVEEQLGALNTLSYKDQAEMLTQEVDSFWVNKSSGSEILKYYLAGDLDSLSSNGDDIKKSDKFYRVLVLDRNVRMAGRIAGFITKQPTFIAIGALHLPGEKGVITLLRKKGFKVEPVL